MSSLGIGLLFLGTPVTQSVGLGAIHQESPVHLEDVVVSQRRGSSGIKVDHELGQDQIESLNLWSVGEVAEWAGETYGNGQPPLFIINGRRVADRRLYYDLPPDALSRVEVLAPGSAAAFGGTPGGRAFNIVLKRTFNSRAAELRVRAPTDGGLTGLEILPRHHSLSGLDIFGLTLGASRTTALWSDERSDLNMASTNPNASTLRPATRQVSGQLALGRSLGNWSASLNAHVGETKRESVAVVGGAQFISYSQDTSVGVMIGLSGDAYSWKATASVRADAFEGRRRGYTLLNSEGYTLGASLAASRSFPWPALPGIVSLEASVVESRVEIDRPTPFRESGLIHSWLTQLTIPLVDEPPEGPALLSEMNLSLSLGRQGGGNGSGTNLRVALSGKVGTFANFNAGWMQSANAPPEADRLTPLSDGPPMLIYDFRLGQIVQVATIEGGNPALRPTLADEAYASIEVGPSAALDTRATLRFATRNGAGGIVRDLPVTTRNENLFSERFIRGADGHLVRVDRRPINLAEFSTSDLELTLSADLPSRLLFPNPIQISAAYRWTLENSASGALGEKALNRLAGDDGGASSYGAKLGLSTAGGRWTFNFLAHWQNGYRVRQFSGQDGPDDLIIGESSAMDVRFGYALGTPSRVRSAESRPTISRTRLELAVENLGNSRRAGRIADGRPLLGWAAASDPVGRMLRVRLSSRF